MIANKDSPDFCRLIKRPFPAKKGQFAVFGLETPYKSRWWKRPTLYRTIPIHMWGVVALVNSAKGARTNDMVVPFVRVDGKLEDATDVPGYLGFIDTTMGEDGSLFADEAAEFAANVAKARKAAEEERRKTLN